MCWHSTKVIHARQQDKLDSWSGTLTHITVCISFFKKGGIFSLIKDGFCAKVSFFVQSIKKKLISHHNFDIQTCFSQFLWLFSLKCWFKGQIISRIHLSLPNAYKMMCFDRNINGNRDVKFLIGIIGHCTDPRKLL